MARRDWLVLMAFALLFVAAIIVRYPSDPRLQAAVQRLEMTTQQSAQRIADAWQRVTE